MQRLLSRLMRWRFVAPDALPQDRGKAPGVDPGQLQERYGDTGLDREDESFVLYRIIGNDLTPRHRAGQSLDNLRFILEHEPELEDCSKRFVVNRIVDREQEARVIELLESAGQPYLHIPFSWDEYAQAPWDVAGIPARYLPPFNKFQSMLPEQAGQVLMRLYQHRNIYTMNNNGARNAALAEGCGLAKWVLPWDGNCFVTQAAWQDIHHAVTARPEMPYHMVPLARISGNRELLDPGFKPSRTDEPQIIFRRDAMERFDENYYYGRRPKVEMLWRLGVPGVWDRWGIQPWDLPCPDYCADAGAFEHAGWVARLQSGQPAMEAAGSRGSSRRRTDARTGAVVDFLDRLDQQLIHNGHEYVALCSAGGELVPSPTDLGEMGRQGLALATVLDESESFDVALLYDAVFLLQASGEDDCHARSVALLARLLEHAPDWSATGITDTCGLFWFLDGLRSLRRQGQADTELLADVDQWLQRYLEGLDRTKARMAEDASGFSHDLQVICLGLYLDRADRVTMGLRDACCRLARLAASETRPAWKALRVQIQLVLHIDRLARVFGPSLWGYPHREQPWIGTWIEQLCRKMPGDSKKSPLPGPIALAYRHRLGDWPAGVDGIDMGDTQIRDVAVRPFWQFDLTDVLRDGAGAV